LPFTPPDDPVFKAKSAAIEEVKGKGKAFWDLSLPQMTLDLRQGVGRLIRRATDMGAIAILDGRLQTKTYTSYVLRSLPPATRISRIEDVARFLGRGGHDA
jgi:ATP-dependent DNA helicase DinG